MAGAPLVLEEQPGAAERSLEQQEQAARRVFPGAPLDAPEAQVPQDLRPVAEVPRAAGLVLPEPEVQPLVWRRPGARLDETAPEAPRLLSFA